MGLDMYLSRKFYVKNWSHNAPKDKWQITVKRGGKVSAIPVKKISYVETEEIYWRKANAIHKWFVENVQKGVDDCGTYYVEREQLEGLLTLVVDVLDKHALAKKVLPTTAGFFFGDTEYDKYYFEDMERTRKELSRILSEGEDGPDGEFYYHSSW
jgi:hypothetical protein